jgi:hypothetical protein
MRSVLPDPEVGTLATLSAKRGLPAEFPHARDHQSPQK